MSSIIDRLKRTTPTTLVDALANKAADREVDSGIHFMSAEDYKQQAADAYAELSARSITEVKLADRAATEADALRKAQAILEEAGVTL